MHPKWPVILFTGLIFPLLPPFASQAQTLSKQFATTGGITESNPATVTAVSTLGAFGGDEIGLTGTGLSGQKIKFYIGKTPLTSVSTTDTHATVQIPPKAKSGVLKIKEGKKETTTSFEVTIFNAPRIQNTPRYASIGSRFPVTGSGFSAVTQWKIGDLLLEVDSATPATDKKVTLKVPPSAAVEGTLSATVNGRVFSGDKPIVTGTAPVVSRVMYMPVARKEYKYAGIAEGSGFTPQTTLKVGGKAVDVVLHTTAGDPLLEFRVKHKLSNKKVSVVAANGPFESASVELDGKRMGFSIAPGELSKALLSDPPGLSLLQIRQEVEALQGRIESRCAGWAELSDFKNATKAAAASGECAAAYLESITWARYYQGAICRTMESGEAASGTNTPAGELLDALNSQMSSWAAVSLAELWKKTIPEMLSGTSSKKMRLDAAVDRMEQIVESRSYAWRSCEGKFYGSPQKSAAQSVHFSMEDIFRGTFPVAFTSLWHKLNDEKKFDAQVKKILKPVRAEMANFWRGTIIEFQKKPAAPPSRPKTPVKLF